MSAETQKAISAAIRKVRQGYIEKKLAPSYFDINNGLCDEFAESVLEHLDEAGKDLGALGERKIYSVEGGNFMRGGDCWSGDWDSKLLQAHWKIGPPKQFTWRQLKDMEFGCHVWVTDGSRHYDAECPEGVESFFDLPLFRRYLVCALRERGIDCPEVETEDVIPAPLCPIVVREPASC